MSISIAPYQTASSSLGIVETRDRSLDRSLVGSAVDVIQATSSNNLTVIEMRRDRPLDTTSAIAKLLSTALISLLSAQVLRYT